MTLNEQGIWNGGYTTCINDMEELSDNAIGYLYQSYVDNTLDDMSDENLRAYVENLVMALECKNFRVENGHLYAPKHNHK